MQLLCYAMNEKKKERDQWLRGLKMRLLKQFCLDGIHAAAETAERMEGKQRLRQWKLIRLSAFLVSSLSHPAKGRRTGADSFFYQGFTVMLAGWNYSWSTQSLIISSRINTGHRCNFRVDPIKEILRSARARGKLTLVARSWQEPDTQLYASVTV